MEKDLQLQLAAIKARAEELVELYVSALADNPTLADTATREKILKELHDLAEEQAKLNENTGV